MHYIIEGQLNIFMSTGNSDHIFSVRLPQKDGKEFKQKYPSRGKRAKIVRALIQMLLKGEIKDVKYVDELT